MVSTFYNSFIIIHLGDFNIPCPGDPFLEPVGEKFVKKDNGNKEETDEVDTEEINEASKAIDLGGSKETSVKFKEDKTLILSFQMFKEMWQKFKPTQLIRM